MSEIAKNKEQLLEIAKDIRNVVSERQKELELSFIEDTHIYYMKDLTGEIRTNYPSVSTVIKQFYEEFPDLEKSLDMCNGNIVEQDELLKKWRATADYANSKGSRTHFLLETDLLKLYGSYKEVRVPIFDCDEDQIRDSNAMIDAGHKFIQLMHRRGAVLLDTEMVLGSPELGYTGQPDKVWIMLNEEGELGMLITDWKGLPLDTPIFTNSGWKTMGTLTKNDKVYDKDGNLVDILNISKVKNKKCLKIIFDNNEEIVSDFEHRWLVFKDINEKDDIIMTTQEIYDYYNLGYNESINIGIINGLNLPINNNSKINKSFRNRVDLFNTYKLLYGELIGDKYRLTINENIEEVIQLISTFGIKIYFINGNTIEFYQGSNNMNYKTIVSVEEVDSVPTKCIEVDSPSSTFLYGHTFSVTHNTNKPKNFEVHSYTKPMLPPFDDYMDTALSHYMIQLPLYGRLLLDMLKGTKYEGIKFFGAIIVHLTDNSKFTEYRTPKTFINTVLTMDPLIRIDEIMRNKKEYAKKEELRKKLLNETINK